MTFKPIYIVNGARTPFLKARNAPGPFAASDLAVAPAARCWRASPSPPSDLDEVILGCASPRVDEVNIGRVAALRLGCGDKVPGWTVMRNCASGMQALDSAIANIQAGPRAPGAGRRRRRAVAHAAALFRRDGALVRRAWYAGQDPRPEAGAVRASSASRTCSRPSSASSRASPTRWWAC